MAERTTHGPRGRETALALAGFLLLAALVVGVARLGPLDTREGLGPAPHDAASALYPAWRHSAERWAAGDVPLWNRSLFLGVPWLANPRAGVLDPQVLALAALEAVGGRELFERGLTWSAWLRVAAAGLGAWLLARRLGLGPGGAACAGIGFALSGASILGTGTHVGHATALLPWVLLGLEALGAARPARLALLATALVFAARILGGPPAAALFCGLAAGASALALAREGRGGGRRALVALGAGSLLAAPMLLPWLASLRDSGALLAQHAALASAPRGDLFALGLLLIVGGALARWRILNRAEIEGERSMGLPAVCAPALLLAGGAALLVWRGWSSGVGLVLVHDLFGRPGAGAGYGGPGLYVEQGGIAWLPLILLGPALAGLLGASTGGLRRPRLWSGLGVAALLLTLAAPGAVDAWHLLAGFGPGFGPGATAGAAGVACLCLALVAGAVIESGPRAPRRVAGLALGVLLVATLVRPRLETGFGTLTGAERAGDAGGELVQLDRPLPARLPPRSMELSGRVHGGLAVRAARLRLEPWPGSGDGRQGRVLPLAFEPDVEGGGRFSAPRLETEHLAPGHWRFVLELLGVSRRASSRVEGLDLLGARVLGSATLARRPRPDPWRLAASLLGLALVSLVDFARRPRRVWLAALGVAALGLDFARGQGALVPRATPRVPDAALARIAELQSRGAGRVLPGPGLLAGNTALVHGLATLAGDEALAPASFDGFRSRAQRPGAHPRRDWNAHGIDATAPAFRLLGTTLALSAEPPAGSAGDAGAVSPWELVGGPWSADPGGAPLYVHALRDPAPLAFLVPRLVPGALARGPLGFDPRVAAFVDPPHAPFVRPFEHGQVELLSLEGNRASLRVRCDGEALLVLCEQSLPGWRVRVDGSEADVVTADGVLRAVVLGPGEHDVSFRFVPVGLRPGLVLAVVGALLAGFTALRERGRAP